jgi:hypothetical protein
MLPAQQKHSDIAFHFGGYTHAAMLCTLHMMHVAMQHCCSTLQQTPASLNGCIVTPYDAWRLAPRIVPTRVVIRLELMATLARPPLLRDKLSDAEMDVAPSYVWDCARLPITRAGMEGLPLPRLGPPRDRSCATAASIAAATAVAAAAAGRMMIVPYGSAAHYLIR